jgi:NAD+ synthase
VDDIADLMPLKNFYRSQILQIAAHLGVPDEIMARTPNPDIIPGVNDKYMDLVGLPYDTLDLLVNGIEHGLEDTDIAYQLNLPTEKVRQIRDLVCRTEHMRRPSQTVSWER